LRDASNISKHELIGLNVTIASSSDSTLVGRKGVVVDESRDMLVIEADGKEIKVPKEVVVLAFDDYNIMIEGKKIRYRPEDRIKKVR